MFKLSYNDIGLIRYDNTILLQKVNIILDYTVKSWMNEMNIRMMFD